MARESIPSYRSAPVFSHATSRAMSACTSSWRRQFARRFLRAARTSTHFALLDVVALPKKTRRERHDGWDSRASPDWKGTRRTPEGAVAQLKTTATRTSRPLVLSRFPTEFEASRLVSGSNEDEIEAADGVLRQVDTSAFRRRGRRRFDFEQSLRTSMSSWQPKPRSQRLHGRSDELRGSRNMSGRFDPRESRRGMEA